MEFKDVKKVCFVVTSWAALFCVLFSAETNAITNNGNYNKAQ